MALFGGAMLRPMAHAASRVALRGQKRFAGGLKIHDQNKAHVFGEVPGHHKKEGWETIWYLTLAASAVMLVFGIGQKPVTGIEVRAMLMLSTDKFLAFADRWSAADSRCGALASNVNITQAEFSGCGCLAAYPSLRTPCAACGIVT
eukprot:TRINITY_DN1292_c0_g1_i1.p1 TRINITY_DN1292_c0_g1~~TRINITY_DN1292_c0_g1_i1.p1  ORF type:complete len:146 (-),score=14.67 TRINITY_DN1292_c0_g1_i1:1832-2269(-)